MKIISKPSYTDICCVSGNASNQFLNIRTDENFKILPYQYILLTKPSASWAILNFSNSRGKHKAAIFIEFQQKMMNRVPIGEKISSL